MLPDPGSIHLMSIVSVFLEMLFPNQLGKRAVVSDQRLVIALLGDHSILQHDDPVAIDDC